ncbi:MAG: threonine/serine dehydratase, partial [Gammaproteobacteria bacterium]
LVSETDIIHTMRLIWEHLKITVEASSAVALAPLLDRSLPVSGKVGVILTGGNVDLDDLPWR